MPVSDWLVSDAHDLSALSGPFDVIVLSDLLHDAWDMQGLLNELRRLLPSGSPSGHEFPQSVVGTPARCCRRVLGLAPRSLKQNWVTVPDVANLLHLSGFNIIRS